MREIVPSRRAVKWPLALERAGDDAADAVLAVQDLSGDAAVVIELLQSGTMASCAAIWKTESAEV